MNQRQEIIERLKALELEGGSHQMLSDICRAVAPGAKYGWTQGACDGLRLRLISFLSETDEEALREAYTKGREDGMGMANAKDAQAEYLRGKNDGYDAGYDAGFASADDWCAQHEDAMAEHGWIRLPLSEDGEPIRIGELVDERLLFGGYAKPAPVDGMELYRSANGYGWMVKLDTENRALISPKLLRHHKQPTVEDVLWEFICDHEEGVRDEVDLIAEYAAKLRLAGDAE